MYLVRSVFGPKSNLDRIRNFLKSIFKIKFVRCSSRLIIEETTLLLFKLKGDDGVVACSLFNGTVGSIEQMYTPRECCYKSPVLLDDPIVGLTEQSVRLEDGKLVCSFKRAKSLPEIQNFFDLHVKYYVLFASGKLEKGLYFLG